VILVAIEAIAFIALIALSLYPAFSRGNGRTPA